MVACSVESILGWTEEAAHCSLWWGIHPNCTQILPFFFFF